MSETDQREELKRGLFLGARFAFVGVASAGVYFALLWALSPIVHRAAALAAICYVGSMGFNFLAQNFFTFGRQSVTGVSLGKYLTMHAGLIAINSGLMGLLVDRMSFNLYLAQAMTTGIVMVISFAVSKMWVYR